MTRTRRILAHLMAILVALPLLCSTAMADDGYTFVVQNSEDGYTYLLYQMFVGDASGSGTPGDPYVLSNINWGSSVPAETREAMYTKYALEGNDQTAAKVAEAIKEASKTDSNVFHSLMTYMNQLGKTGGASLTPYKTLAKGLYQISGQSQQVQGYGATSIPAGYYLVRNTGVPNDSSAYSDYIVEVVGGDVVANPKAAVGSTEKKVRDINDSTTSGLGSPQDSADYDMGDTIPFTLTATLPQDYGKYNQFKLIFEDDMSAGLTLITDPQPKVYYGAADTTGTPITLTPVTNGTEISVGNSETITLGTSYAGGQLYTYDCGDLKTAHSNLTAGDTVRIEYQARLNANAIVGSTGNANKHRIIYSNDSTQVEHMGASTYDTNIVFTYKVELNKVDENNAALTGANFKLEKFVAAGNGASSITVNGQEIKGSWVDVTALNGTGDGAVNPAKTGDENGSTFAFSGLDDGRYRITETKTPAGYNTIPQQEFDIKATHTDGDNPALAELTGTDGVSFTMQPNVATATLSTAIENKAGLVLPATGGMSTKILAVAGAVLLLGSVVLLVTRRRVRVE